ncbi:MAG: 30S ribosomal protein S2 [Deltaproteobacteria bacterium CG_4_10_14_0_2_um_filter_43_8]|nr:MAG: 30S ribosomal protein S2 [Deltaproteobacteria bacterium CG11_big_fil_rev_8_21_14_0_20_42_23]PJA18738.1 MAG: 30S ribosomal protein S2 [Deltaproteobacteria bacterium CG_4_10_14_0_2_um_filter_43_8]PJC64404.1 MAG: 30S ribosomal protein S2 [Deltaproteobacteria bacterium CG_4_9_14_0_2_um_filter_42_21]
MSITVSIKEMLEAGAHFGHQTKRWNPKMRPYIFTQRNGIHIIDLDQTAAQAKKAANFILETVASGKRVLFVGTKKQARETIAEAAKKADQFYVINRWMGGTLTNFKTIKASIDRMVKLMEMRDNGEFEKLIKKEGLKMARSIEKLEENLGGIREMKKAPGAVILVDPSHEHIAKKEAMRLNIPVVALLDTNCDPDNIDYPIACNDDAIRSIQYFMDLFTEACIEGGKLRDVRIRADQEKSAQRKEEEKKSMPRVREKKMAGNKTRAYTAKKAEHEEGASAEEVETFAKASAEKKEN